MKKLLLFFIFFISINTLAGPKYIKYDNGDVEFVENIKNNKKEGSYKYYFKNGNIEEGTYRNGKEEGPYTRYFNDGSREEGIYKNGQRIKLR